MEAKALLFCFLFFVICVSCSVQWNARVNEVNNEGISWGVYGLYNQVLLQQNSQVSCDSLSCSRFYTEFDQNVVIISSQCEDCIFPAIGLNLENIKNSKLSLVSVSDHEVVILKATRFDNELETIRNVATELCEIGAFDGPCDKTVSLIVDSYVWHVAQEMKYNHSNEVIDRISYLSNKFRTMKITNEDPIVPLLASVSEESQRQFLDGLTSIHTRLSTAGAVTLQASYYLFGLLQGFGLEPNLFYYDNEFPPDVCADIVGSLEPEKLVVVGAHYDDRASDIQNTTVRAPGANDDGSGCALLQEVAKILSGSGYTFRYTTRICFWAGEEQGLVGSSAYAAALKSNETTVVGMLQADMIGYLTPGKPFGVDMASRETDSALTELVNQITATYVPDLIIGSTTSCCTDSASFTREGYPAVAYNEPGGYTIDPQYHSTLDIVNRPGYNLSLIGLITQAVLAATAVLAEIV